MSFVLGNAKPTIYHDVELSYIPSADEKGDGGYEIIATGEVVEPEMMIHANGEDILIERIHPAYILADNSVKENPKLSGKEHM